MNKLSIAAGLVALGLSTMASAGQVQVKITNNAGVSGTYLTPAWFGFHDGNFDLFNAGSAASASLEAIAEDGNSSVLSTDFNNQQATAVDGSTAGLLAPGTSASTTFNLSDNGSNDYFSFAAMVLPSSDYFIGNDNAFNISSLLDNSFSKISFDIGTVYDAGTEVNDFATSAGNGLFGISGGQMAPGEGADENGVVSLATGANYAFFLNQDGSDLTPLNFSNYQSLATIEISNVSAVPVPAAAFLFAPALLGFMGLRRRRQS